MFKLLMAQIPWGIINKLDNMTGVILWILACMSIISWAIFFHKSVSIFLHKYRLNRLIMRVKGLRSSEELQLASSDFIGTVPGSLLSRTTFIVNSYATNYSAMKKIGNCPVSSYENNVKEHIYQVVDEIIQDQESGIAFLNMSAAVAPLLGLFGTVWGLVQSFLAMSELKSADITVIAPGMAQALVTTLVGLMVAIPSVMMFHYLSTNLQYLEGRYATLVDSISMLIATHSGS